MRVENLISKRSNVSCDQCYSFNNGDLLLLKRCVHDLRSPLAAMKVVTKFEEELSPDLKQIIMASTDRISFLVDQLSDQFSGQQSRQFVPRVDQNIGRKNQESKQKCDQNEISEPTIGQFIESLIFEKEFEFNAHKTLAFMTEIDKTAYCLRTSTHPLDLKCILSNLINNSADAQNYTGQIRVRAQRSKTISRVMIEVIDHGKGIPVELQDKIGSYGFTHGKKGGQGIGLYFALRLIKEHGGQMEIQSTVGKGTVVRIALPIKE